MILGVISDTHGQVARTAAAVQLLRRVGAEGLVCCGDIGGAGVLDELAAMKTWMVPGNTDEFESGLETYAHTIGITFHAEAPLCLRLGGRSLAAFHGHEALFSSLFEETPLSEAIRSKLASYDYLLHGHTHTACDVRWQQWRVINPGALHRAPLPTVATIDLERDEVQHWRVPDGPTDAEPMAVEL